MKKYALLVVAIVLMAMLMSCSSSASVSRVQTGTAAELSGDWNERDVEIICSSMLDEMFHSPRYMEYSSGMSRRPRIRVGSFVNESDEHIDTSIVTRKMQDAIFSSGLADFVSERSFLSDLHYEQDYGLMNANPDEAASIGNEAAADLLLQGSVQTIVQKSGRQEVRTYYVYAQLVDVETALTVWTGMNDEISKVVTEPSVRW